MGLSRKNGLRRKWPSGEVPVDRSFLQTVSPSEVPVGGLTSSPAEYGLSTAANACRKRIYLGTVVNYYANLRGF